MLRAGRSHAQHQAARLNPLPNWQRRVGLAVVLTLLLSGALWLAVHFLRWPMASRAAVEGLPSPWEAGLMRVHGAAAMLALFVLGAMSSTHVVRGWRLQRRRPSGIAVLSLVGVLVLSAYGLYYLVPDDWRDGWGLLHAALGLSAGLAVLWHRRRRRA